MKAMILAAGEGTRLRPLTLTCPKPMVPVAGTPLLVRTLQLLQRANICQIAMNLHHRPEEITQTLGKGEALGVHLTFSLEKDLLGTAGALRPLAGFLDETFLLLYGDNLYDFDPAPLLAAHRRSGALATVATFATDNPTACGILATDPDGRVTRFVEKPAPEEVFSHQASAGIYVLEPAVLDLIPADGAPDFGRDIFPALLEERPGALFALPLNGYLQDTGTPSGYRKANWDALKSEPGAALAKDAWVAAGARLPGQNIIGSGCRVASGAQLFGSILWDNAFIGEGASVSDAVIGRGARIEADAQVSGGSLIADGAILAHGAILPPGEHLLPGEERKK